MPFRDVEGWDGPEVARDTESFTVGVTLGLCPRPGAERQLASSSASSTGQPSSCTPGEVAELPGEIPPGLAEGGSQSPVLASAPS